MLNGVYCKLLDGPFLFYFHFTFFFFSEKVVAASLHDYLVKNSSMGLDGGFDTLDKKLGNEWRMCYPPFVAAWVIFGWASSISL